MFFWRRGTFDLLLRRDLCFVANTYFSSVTLLLCTLWVKKCATFKSFLNTWETARGGRELSTINFQPPFAPCTTILWERLLYCAHFTGKVKAQRSKITELKWIRQISLFNHKVLIDCSISHVPVYKETRKILPRVESNMKELGKGNYLGSWYKELSYTHIWKFKGTAAFKHRVIMLTVKMTPKHEKSLRWEPSIRHKFQRNTYSLLRRLLIYFESPRLEVRRARF